jgi:hypothetical protein
MKCPIKNEKLWLKVKDLTGTEDEQRRLTKLKVDKYITEQEYWVIRMQWLSNKPKEQ